jgi:hypothetical protein
MERVEDEQEVKLPEKPGKWVAMPPPPLLSLSVSYTHLRTLSAKVTPVHQTGLNQV